MTVRDLMKALADLDPDALVIFEATEMGEHDVDIVAGPKRFPGVGDAVVVLRTTG